MMCSIWGTRKTEVFWRLTHADSPCYRPATTCDCCREHSGQSWWPHTPDGKFGKVQFTKKPSDRKPVENNWTNHLSVTFNTSQSHFFLALSAILCSFFKWETDAQVWSDWPHCSRHCLQASSSLLQTTRLKGFPDVAERIQSRSQSELFLEPQSSPFQFS